MARWPGVPHAFGWLSLDVRGQWRIKGTAVAHPGLSAFIGRHYSADGRGRWYFQNGPQRVYVTLACAPWVLRLGASAGSSLFTHTGADAGRAQAAWIDEQGRLLLQCDAGIGLLDDRDLGLVCAALSRIDGSVAEPSFLLRWMDGLEEPSLRLTADWGEIEVQRIDSATLGERFGFDPDPRPEPGEPEC